MLILAHNLAYNHDFQNPKLLYLFSYFTCFKFIIFFFCNKHNKKKRKQNINPIIEQSNNKLKVIVLFEYLLICFYFSVKYLLICHL